MFSFLGDLASSVVARHPRVRLVAEAIEDAVYDVAEELGPRAVLAACGAVDAVADAVAGAVRAVDDVRGLPFTLAMVGVRIDILAAKLARVGSVTLRHEGTLAELDRRLRTLEAAGDLEAR